MIRAAPRVYQEHGLEATDGRDCSTPLEPGMVFTVEPKLYAPELDIAIMIEAVILVTGTATRTFRRPRLVRWRRSSGSWKRIRRARLRAES